MGQSTRKTSGKIYSLSVKSFRMNLGQRIEKRLQASKLSQSELARRVGVGQSTISALVRGETLGSKHLHRIARELGTTPAFLTGETADPDQDAPPLPDLDAEERELVEMMRGLEPKDRGAIMQLARTISGSVRSPTVHAGGQEFRGQGRR